MVLFDLSKLRGISNEDTIWHPSDALRAYILITANTEIEFDDVQICFEGHCPTLIKNERTISLTKATPFRDFPNLHKISPWQCQRHLYGKIRKEGQSSLESVCKCPGGC